MSWHKQVDGKRRCSRGREGRRLTTRPDLGWCGGGPLGRAGRGRSPGGDDGPQTRITLFIRGLGHTQAGFMSEPSREHTQDEDLYNQDLNKERSALANTSWFGQFAG